MLNQFIGSVTHALHILHAANTNTSQKTTLSRTALTFLCGIIRGSILPKLRSRNYGQCLVHARCCLPIIVNRIESATFEINRERQQRRCHQHPSLSWLYWPRDCIDHELLWLWVYHGSWIAWIPTAAAWLTGFCIKWTSSLILFASWTTVVLENWNCVLGMQLKFAGKCVGCVSLHVVR